MILTVFFIVKRRSGMSAIQKINIIILDKVIFVLYQR